MSESVPATHRELLERPIVASLATLLPSGQIQVHPVWCSYDNHYLLINSAKGRAKDRNMRARPDVTALVVDPQNPYFWIEIRGRVVEITERGADQHIEDLSEMYLNQRPYPLRQPGEVRVMYKIQPQRVVVFGPDG